MSKLRFTLYKAIVARLNQTSFRIQKVQPMQLPSNEEIKTIPFAAVEPRTEIEGLFDMENFPEADDARARLARVRSGKTLMGLLTKFAPDDTPEIPDNAEELVKAVYHRSFKKVWPHEPKEPDALRNTDDLLASLAVSGPFADYLRKMRDTDVQKVAALAQDKQIGVSTDDYCIDLLFMEEYPVKQNLMQVGGMAVFGVEGSRLSTKGLYSSQPDLFVSPRDELWRQHRSRFLAGFNEYLTTIRHNTYIHLIYVTSMTVSTFNSLPPDHAVRRLLHPCFQSALVGNRELAQLQIRGEDAFAARIFSHEHEQVVAMIQDSLSDFSLSGMDPQVNAQQRGVLETPFEYPHRDMVLAYWKLTLSAVTKYLSVFYETEDELSENTAIVKWLERLYQMLPGSDTTGDALPEKITIEFLARICAAFIHTSTVTHDVINNMVWNYSTMNHLIPTVVPLGGKRQPQLNSFELILTLIGTWKPYNMLLEGQPFRATNESAQKVVDDYLEDLRSMLDHLPTNPRRPDQVYPDELNYSVSN